MKAVRRAATVLGLGAFAIAALVYVTHVLWLGFPDGHLTELDRARRPVALLFVLASGLLGVGFIGLGRFSSDTKVHRHVSMTTGLYLAVALLFSIVSLSLAARLNSGQGG